MRLEAKWALVISLCSIGCATYVGPGPVDGGPTFAEAGVAALTTLEGELYANGDWQVCQPADAGCGQNDIDWGADSLTYALWLAWSTSRDPSIPPMMHALNANGLVWGTCTQSDCVYWSDVPQWDSVAATREYQVTSEESALARARGAFDYVDTATQFGLGACPDVDYQQPGGGTNKLKTLETDSNYVKAALLLWQATGEASYLSKAAAKYQAIRRWFLDPTVALYTVYVFDDGAHCTQLPARFFASVNGNMIWSGIALADAMPGSSYLNDAIASAQAVAQHLNDSSGLYADMQAENDVAEPLVEAMYLLASEHGQAFAKAWLTTNAASLPSDLTNGGAYGRFWNGPAPRTTVSEWQSNGGLALAIASAAIAPDGTFAPDIWADAGYVADDLSTLPGTLTFRGRAIALIGTIGEHCCEDGHAQVWIDGAQTFDQTGIWQDKSSAGRALPNSVLFAWRWPASGSHTIDFKAGDVNGKEGHPFLHLQGYYLVP